MTRCFGWLAAALAVWSAAAGELRFDFSQAPVNETPPGFRSALSGEGRPGDWRVVLDDAPSAFAPVTGLAEPPQRRVLAQISRELKDERFPLLIYDEQAFGDFKFTTKFKTVSGVMEQMAGVAFRIQDEKNYYYVRASSLGNTFRFFKVVDGVRGPPIGPDIEIPSGVWHELSIECEGNQIRCRLNGEEAIPPLTDYSFTLGKIGFWTKSDSVSYFVDARIDYEAGQRLPDQLIQEALQRYPRLLGLKIFAFASDQPDQPVIIGSDQEGETGQLGGDVERDVLTRGSTYFGRDSREGTVTVTLPMDDRNGDVAAAVRVVMKSFLGQTEKNAIVRAMPIVKEMERRTRAVPEFPGRFAPTVR